jgi:hemolysin-activating ACP:hemolysin acyltransferase
MRVDLDGLILISSHFLSIFINQTDGKFCLLILLKNQIYSLTVVSHSLNNILPVLSTKQMARFQEATSDLFISA